MLALNENKLITSDYIAGSVNTNPVVIRRILASLRRAGLVTSQPGVGGGWQIAQSPDLISLLDVHCSVEQEPLFSLHSQQPNPDCPVGRNIQQALSNLFGEAEEAMKQVLAQTTIGEVLHSIQFRAGSTAET